MKKKYVVKNNREFDYIIKKGYNLSNKYFIIYYKKNTFKYDRFGISVGKKLGNAVFRNKYKRKLRNIIDDYKKEFKNTNIDYIIILRKSATNLTYTQLKGQFYNIINNILKGLSNEKK